MPQLSNAQYNVVVHADTGAGNIFNKSLVREGHGLYYHVAMESGKQNQVFE